MKSNYSDIVKSSKDRTFGIANNLDEKHHDRLAEITELAAAILGVHAEIVAELEAKKSEERPGA